MRGASTYHATSPHVALVAFAAVLLPLDVKGAISTVGFSNRYYRGYGYTGTRVLEHNKTGRFLRYVEVTWTQSATVDVHDRVWIADRAKHLIVCVEAGTRYVPWPAFYKEYAGIYNEPGHFDGYRLQSRFDGPMGIAVSSVAGEPLLIFVADTNNHCIRRIDYSEGRTSTIVGGPELQGLKDGPGMEARFNAPMSLGIDSTGKKLFVLDNVRLIRYVDLTPMIPTVVTLIGGACRAVSRHTVVSSIIIRRVGCHSDWHARDEEGGTLGIEQFSNPVMCVGHHATCNPRHHPALADRRAPRRYEAPAERAV